MNVANDNCRSPLRPRRSESLPQKGVAAVAQTT